MKKQFLTKIENDPQAVITALDGFEKFAKKNGLLEKSIFAARLCLEEVLVNIVSYAFVDKKPHMIQVHAEVEVERTLKIKVEDDGIAFNPLVMVPKPDLDSDIENRPIGGIGIHLVKSMMNQVTYDRQKGKNILTMTQSQGEPF